jgi:hypothetical protein
VEKWGVGTRTNTSLLVGMNCVTLEFCGPAVDRYQEKLKSKDIRLLL